VSWYEADAFARFAGARLPSEAEWEAAASWDSAAGCKRRFPWGDDASATPANLGLCLLDVAGPGAFAGGASPCGAVDMAGGVWEWVADTFEPYPGFLPQAYAGYSAPWFGARHRCARGGSFMTQAEIARCCFRNWYEPHLRAPTLGFRLARSLRSP
jgi:iron(II)-dependent oxidoreductase